MNYRAQPDPNIAPPPPGPYGTSLNGFQNSNHHATYWMKVYESIKERVTYTLRPTAGDIPDTLKQKHIKYFVVYPMWDQGQLDILQG